MGSLANKVALVTGGGQGIGQGVSYALAAEGAAVSVVGRTLSKVETTVREIERRGGRGTAIEADVTEPEQVADAVGRTVAELGGLDVLVNNAQEFNFGGLLDIRMESVEAGWRSGPLASLLFMRIAHPHLRDGGSIVNISSGAALADNPAGTGAYAATKAAIQSLSRAAAVEWAADGIRVNVLIPFARTPATQAVFDAQPEIEHALISQVPLGRIGDAEADIGRVVAFLVGPAASYMTGTTVVADGGSSYLR